MRFVPAATVRPHRPTRRSLGSVQRAKTARPAAWNSIYAYFAGRTPSFYDHYLARDVSAGVAKLFLWVRAWIPAVPPSARPRHGGVRSRHTWCVGRPERSAHNMQMRACGPWGRNSEALALTDRLTPTAASWAKSCSNG
jgi:hypothetical protein